MNCADTFGNSGLISSVCGSIRTILRYMCLAGAMLALPSCGDGMSAQDREFVNKIKKHLKNKGDTIKISDIHPGEWILVCLTNDSGFGGDVLELAHEDLKIEKTAIEIINRPVYQASFMKDFDWGIYFVYPPNKIEYFVISEYALGQGSVWASGPCATKESAYLVTSTGQWKMNDTEDYMNISVEDREFLNKKIYKWSKDESGR